jgi:Family of unknown function (DUF6174)
MYPHVRPRMVAVSLALCAALLFACGLGTLFLTRAPSIAARAQQLADARNRWQSRTISHYRLVMQAPSWCRLDVEIQGEKVVRVFENSCPTSPRTVTGLFDLIKQLDSTADTIFCAPLGCECTEVRYIYASYDQDMGFPRTIRLRRDRQMNWPELWRFLVTHGLPNCLTPRDIDLVEIVSLNPIS